MAGRDATSTRATAVMPSPAAHAAAPSGDRIEIKMTNMSMMAHPMHPHGHHFQVVAIDGNRIAGAVRDTVLILRDGDDRT